MLSGKCPRVTRPKTQTRRMRTTLMLQSEVDTHRIFKNLQHGHFQFLERILSLFYIQVNGTNFVRKQW